MTGDGWNPTHKNGDGLGMVSWLYHIIIKCFPKAELRRWRLRKLVNVLATSEIMGLDQACSEDKNISRVKNPPMN